MPTITLPSELTGALATPSTTQDTESDLFGVDLLFTDDLQLTSSGDYATVEGLDALRQSIRNRLLTNPGEYAVHPEYGCGLRAFCKKRGTQSEIDALRQTIIDQLSQDDRIQKITKVDIASFIQNNMPGVKIFIQILALGRENSFQMQTFAD